MVRLARPAVVGPLVALLLGLGTSAAHAQLAGGWGWGANDAGQLGTAPGGASKLPVATTFHDDIVALKASYLFTVALRSTGTLLAWGDNDEGQHFPSQDDNKEQG